MSECRRETANFHQACRQGLSLGREQRFTGNLRFILRVRQQLRWLTLFPFRAAVLKTSRVSIIKFELVFNLG